MALEDILDKIKQEAEQQAEEIVEQATEKAEELVSRLQAETEAEVQSIREKGERSAQMEHHRAQSLANLESRKEILATRQEIVAKAIEEAVRRLAALPPEDYFPILERLIQKADISGDVELILSASDKERLPGDFLNRVNQRLEGKAHLTLGEETRELAGGLALRSGRMEENLSFEALVREMRNDLEKEIADLLFENQQE